MRCKIACMHARQRYHVQMQTTNDACTGLFRQKLKFKWILARKVHACLYACMLDFTCMRLHTRSRACSTRACNRTWKSRAAKAFKFLRHSFKFGVLFVHAQGTRTYGAQIRTAAIASNINCESQCVALEFSGLQGRYPGINQSVLVNICTL